MNGSFHCQIFYPLRVQYLWGVIAFLCFTLAVEKNVLFDIAVHYKDP